MCLSFLYNSNARATGKCLCPHPIDMHVFWAAARYTDDPIRAHNCHTRFISIYFSYSFRVAWKNNGRTKPEKGEKKSIRVDIFDAAARLTDGYHRRTRVDAFVSNIQFGLSATQIGCSFRCRRRMLANVKSAGSLTLFDRNVHFVHVLNLPMKFRN